MDGPVSFWNHARQYLPFGSGASEAEIHQRLMDGRAQLWTAPHSAAVTEITDANWLRLWLAGGKMAEILDVLPHVERTAVAMGCMGLECDGRKGWVRVLGRFGYVNDGQDLRKWL